MGGYGDEPRLLYRGQSLITPFHMDLYKIINKEIWNILIININLIFKNKFSF